MWSTLNSNRKSYEMGIVDRMVCCLYYIYFWQKGNKRRSKKKKNNNNYTGIRQRHPLVSRAWSGNGDVCLNKLADAVEELQRRRRRRGHHVREDRRTAADLSSEWWRRGGVGGGGGGACKHPQRGQSSEDNSEA